MFSFIFNSTPVSLNNSLRQDIETLSSEITLLKAENYELRTENTELKRRLNSDSGNSNIPSGSLPAYKKCGKERTLDSNIKKKPNGGQVGHKGSTLTQVDNPDEIILHTVDQCSCGIDISDLSSSAISKRQVFDIVIKRHVIEHQTETKTCPCCGKDNTSEFPDDITSQVQYSSQSMAFATYLNQYQLIPLKRTCEIFSDIFNLPISESIVLKSTIKLASKLEDFKLWIKTQLMACYVIHFDETSLRVGKKPYWLFVATSSKFTYYFSSSKRDFASFAAEGFDEYNGIAIHDHYRLYFKMPNASHALCNAHISRELKGIYEAPDSSEDWSKDMYELLCNSLTQVKESNNSESLWRYEIKRIKREYDKIVKAGLKYHQLLPPLPVNPKNKGRQKQRTGKNLLDRFIKHKDDILRFIADFMVPFTNNNAELALRMMKLQQKISGCFRTEQGINNFALNRSYITTVKKHQIKVIKAIQMALEGKPELLDS